MNIIRKSDGSISKTKVVLLIFAVLAVLQMIQNARRKAADAEASDAGWANADEREIAAIVGCKDKPCYDKHVADIDRKNAVNEREQATPDHSEEVLLGSVANNQNASDESALSWVSRQRKLCNAYQEAPNEIKKSNIYRDTLRLLNGASVDGLKGVLTMISTNQGGGLLNISIDVGEAEFKNQALFASIPRGSSVYKQVEILSEGSCVIFSAKKIEPSSAFEENRVCDLDYFAKITEIKPCS